jgi:hypothetical protein
MSTRIYTVTADHGPDLKKEFLVRATSLSQAINTINKKVYTAQVSSQDDLLRLAKKGNEVIDAAQA